jgi:hypothetical protein
MAPLILMVLGGLGALIGVFVSPRQFAFSWLTTFMFYLSLVLGGLFLVIVHHLFDANWSVPIRRINEHLACLAPSWRFCSSRSRSCANRLAMDDHRSHADHALHSKHALLNQAASSWSRFCAL